MAIRITCTACNKLLRTADGAAGKMVKCPGCGAVLKVPMPASSPAPEPAGEPYATHAPTNKKHGRVILVAGGSIAACVVIALLLTWMLGSHAPAPSAAYNPLLNKTLVVVVETNGAICDARALDALPKDDLEFEQPQGVLVTVFGKVVKGFDPARPLACTASGAKVTVWPKEGNSVVLFGDSLRFGVPLDNAFLARVQEFLAKPAAERPASPTVSEADEEETIYDGPGSPTTKVINGAIKTFLQRTAQTKLIKDTTRIQTSSYDEFASAVVYTKDGAKHTFLVFKEGDGWVAYDQLPTQKDSLYVFSELAGRHLTAKRGQPTSASLCDDSWKNKDLKQRTINFVYDDGGKRSAPVPLRFEYSEKEGWHIVDSSSPQLSAPAGQTGTTGRPGAAPTPYVPVTLANGSYQLAPLSEEAKAKLAPAVEEGKAIAAALKALPKDWHKDPKYRAQTVTLQKRFDDGRGTNGKWAYLRLSIDTLTVGAVGGFEIERFAITAPSAGKPPAKSATSYATGGPRCDVLKVVDDHSAIVRCKGKTLWLQNIYARGIADRRLQIVFGRIPPVYYHVAGVVRNAEIGGGATDIYVLQALDPPIFQ